MTQVQGPGRLWFTEKWGSTGSPNIHSSLPVHRLEPFITSGTWMPRTNTCRWMWSGEEVLVQRMEVEVMHTLPVPPGQEVLFLPPCWVEDGCVWSVRAAGSCPGGDARSRTSLHGKATTQPECLHQRKETLYPVPANVIGSLLEQWDPHPHPCRAQNASWRT